MNSRRKRIASGTLLTALVFALCGIARASEGKGATSQPAGKSGKSYYWYDGAKKRAVFADPGLLAEFGHSGEGAAAVRSVDPGAAVESSPSKNVRLWKLTPGTDGESASRVAVEKEPGSRFSPVFRDGGGGEGRRRALPGGVVVQLNPQLSEKEAHEWARSKGLAVRKKLSLPGNFFVLDTKPGLDALEKANALHESGEVLSASPDWWQEVEAK